MRQRHATLVTLLAAALLAGCATPYGRARTALAEERYEEAASGFEEILTRHPDRLDALIGLGKARYKLGTFDDAITALTRAAARAPKSETAHLYLGLSHLRKGEDGPAEEHLKTLLALGPHPRLAARLELARLPAVLDGLLGDLDPADWRARPVLPNGRRSRSSATCATRKSRTSERASVSRSKAAHASHRSTRNDGPRSGATETPTRGRRWRRFEIGERRALPSSPRFPPIASRLPSSIRGSGDCPASTSSSRGLPMIGSTSPSFPARWRGCGPHAGRRSVPTTRGRSRTESPSGDAVLAPERVT